MRLRKASEADVAPLLNLINDFAGRDMLLGRTEASLRKQLTDFTIAEVAGGVVGCGALTTLAPDLGEVRTLAVREDHAGRGIGRAIVESLLAEAGERGYDEVLAMSRRVSFFQALGFRLTRRERFLDKLAADCHACPLADNCDETALVRPPVVAAVGDELLEEGVA